MCFISFYLVLSHFMSFFLNLFHFMSFYLNLFHFFFSFVSRTRGTATGLTAALSYILTFISAKTYYSLETTLSMPGIALFNCVVILIGLILMYFIMPETENRTLEEIEMHFANNSKKITDRRVSKFKIFAFEKERDPSEPSTRPASVIEVEGKSKKECEKGCDNRAFSENA